MNVSQVARLYGIQPSLLFKWESTIRKAASPPLLPERKSFPPLSSQRH